MADELKVLSKEEVDALLNLTKDNDSNTANFVTEGTEAEEEKWQGSSVINEKALANITELTIVELENIFVSFLRRKLHVAEKGTAHAKLSECLKDKMEKHVYAIFHVMPMDTYGMVVLDLSMLHQAINLIYGGHQTAPDEPIMETPGKIGLIVAEKVCALGLDALKVACADYGDIAYKIIKTIHQPHLPAKLGLDDRVFAIEMKVGSGEMESSYSIMVKEEFLETFIPQKGASSDKDGRHVESNFWRAAIEKQVVDSFVTVSATLPDVPIRISDLMNIKEGDLIPMSDPTLVYICLNNLKLFRAKAGQANSKRVAKVLSEV